MSRLKFIKYIHEKLMIGAAVFVFNAGCASHGLHYRVKSPLVSAQNPRLIAQKRTPLSDTDRRRLLAVAKGALGQSKLKVGEKSYRGDCSGAVRAIFTQAEIGLGGILKSTDDNDVKAIYRYVQKYGKVKKAHPKAGDLIFFHNTYDRSRNGLMNDALTHIGIVEKVEGTTVHFIHHLGQSIIRSRMDLSLPRETYHPKTGVRVNHILRRAQGNHRGYTAAELFAGFGHL